MDQTNTEAPHNRHLNTIIIAGIIVLLAVVFLYFQDRQQQRDLQLRRLEAKVELMEEWSRPRQQNQQNNLPPRTGGRMF